MNYFAKRFKNYTVIELFYITIHNNRERPSPHINIEYMNDDTLLEEITKIERMSSFKCWDDKYEDDEAEDKTDAQLINEFKKYMVLSMVESL